MKQSSGAPQEGPWELQAGQDQAVPGSELGVPPSTVPVAQEGLQQQGSGKESEDQQGSQQNPGTVEGQAPESCQVMSKETRAGANRMTDPQGRYKGRELLKAGKRRGFCIKLKLGEFLLWP